MHRETDCDTDNRLPLSNNLLCLHGFPVLNANISNCKFYLVLDLCDITFCPPVHFLWNVDFCHGQECGSSALIPHDVTTLVHGKLLISLNIQMCKKKDLSECDAENGLGILQVNKQKEKFLRKSVRKRTLHECH